MKPIVNVGSLEISTYVVMISLGAGLGLWLTYRLAERKSLDSMKVLALAALACAAGLLGARGFNVIAGPAGESTWWSVPALWEPVGMSFYGGLGLAALAGLAYARANGLPPWEVADLLAVSFPPGVALARVGCFLNGCCYGKHSDMPWAVSFPVGGASYDAQREANLIAPEALPLPVHPAQLYLAALNLVIFFAIYFGFRPRKRFDGQLFAWLLIGKGVFRSFVEIWRDDDRGVLFGWLSTSQILSVPLVIIGILLLQRRLGTRPSQA